MNLLLVHGRLHETGGIETLILRLCIRFKALGHTVTVLLEKEHEHKPVQDPELLETVRRNARVIYADMRFDLASASLRRLDLPDCDVIYCFSNPALLTGIVLRNEFRPRARVVAGVYHPQEYGWRAEKKRYAHKLVEEAMRRMPIANVIFMNTEFARAQGEYFKRNFSGSPVIPLPIDLSRFGATTRCPIRGKIVSIGRLTDFKTYNFHMVDIVKTLIERGHDLEYHIHGDGSDFERVRRHIVALEMQSRVTLHGNLPYAKMESALADAYVFVGMGTAVVEAAACGVPTLPAVYAQTDAVTHGFFHEPVGGQNLGERIADAPLVPIVDCLERLLAMSPARYAEASRQTKERAREFDIEALTDTFLAALERAEPFDFPLTAAHRVAFSSDLWRWRISKRLGAKKPDALRYAQPP